MRTAFFTQNVKKGGLDTFILNLLSNWPSSDELVLYCNRSHPGLADLQKGLAGKVEVRPYDFWIAQDIAARLAELPRPLRFLFRACFWLLGMPYMVLVLTRLFHESRADRMMVINGGYPGGDACLAATIAWARVRPRRRAWHNFHNLVLPYPRSGARSWKERLIDLCVARAAAGFVTVSAACLRTLECRPRLAAARQAFIHNGIGVPDFAPGAPLVEELGLPAGSRLILMLAVYEQRKGHTFMIEAMKEVVRREPRACLLVCGDGRPAEVEAVRRLCLASGIAKNIVLQGHRSDLARLLGQAEILVMPSQEQESFGYAAVEAMAFACPVVATDVGGLPEVVGDGGYVLSRDDRDAFADRVLVLLRDDALRQRMGQVGKLRYETLFRASLMSAEYFRLLEGKA